MSNTLGKNLFDDIWRGMKEGHNKSRGEYFVRPGLHVIEEALPLLQGQVTLIQSSAIGLAQELMLNIVRTSALLDPAGDRQQDANSSPVPTHILSTMNTKEFLGKKILAQQARVTLEEMDAGLSGEKFRNLNDAFTVIRVRPYDFQETMQPSNLALSQELERLSNNGGIEGHSVYLVALDALQGEAYADNLHELKDMAQKHGVHIMTAVETGIPALDLHCDNVVNIEFSSNETEVTITISKSHYDSTGNDTVAYYPSSGRIDEDMGWIEPNMDMKAFRKEELGRDK
ncbi:MAG: hypothetical protein OCC46_02825 [Pseudodesulfovibrio sp.]